MNPAEIAADKGETWIVDAIAYRVHISVKGEHTSIL
jgi:hypothetical protein